ncbi:MAG: DegT/DnrJ/EryC1/StrS family aminotransferase [Syntrophobacteraceae bacterium]
MQFIDLASQQTRIRQDIEARIKKVLDHGQYIMGPEVLELEKTLAEYVSMPHALSCASGTDALLLALMALDVQPGDAVFTTPFTFMATAEVIALLRATPVFVDIDPVTFNMDPERLALAIHAVESGDADNHPLPRGAVGWGLRARGVIPVDLFGLPADYGRINSIAQSRKLFVIEDGAQSFGAEAGGRKACCLSELTCTSFFPAKPLGGYGDGGMCFTTDEDLLSLMRSIRIHGQGEDKYENVRIGINGRLDTLQAAVLLAKFSIFQEEVQLRQAVAARYTRLLSEMEVNLIPPIVPPDYLSAWAQYSVLARDEKHRAACLDRLRAAGIPSAIYYPKPLHRQRAFKDLDYREGDFPVSEDCARRIFSLPMHPYLEARDQERICRTLKG